METECSSIQKCRALLVCGAFSPEPCGVGDYTARLADSFVDAGVDVHILTSNRAEPSKRFRIHSLVSDWTDRGLVRNALGSVLDSIRPDVVQIEYPGSYGPANRALSGNLLPHWVRSRGFRVCTTLHEWGERRLQWRIRAAMMALRSHALVAVTSHDARILRRTPLVGRRVVRHIPIGSSLVFDHETRDTGAIPVLAYFGFLDPLKGVRELLETAALLRDRGVAFRLDLHGHFHPDSNAHHAAIRDQVQGSGLHEAVRFPGPVPADSEGASLALREATLGVFPFREGVSERRSSFIALGQAGFPVLTSPGPWQPEWLQDGDNVFLEPLVPARWAERITALLGERSTFGTVGARLQAEIVKRHSWKHITEEHIRLWQSLT